MAGVLAAWLLIGPEELRRRGVPAAATADTLN
jgi:hypothetical protein